jgi:hypothetical protein
VWVKQRGISQNTDSLPFRHHPPLQYIVLRHIPRTRPSGGTIALSQRTQHGILGVLGGHA